MDNKVQNENEKKLEWTKRMNNVKVKPDREAINAEQGKVVLKLKKALDFFENIQIKNEESLDYIKKPLDDLLSSLKYLPVEEGQCFNNLPVEIKRDILNYCCDKGAFVAASVCQEWKTILEPRLIDLECISIGKCCYTDEGPGCDERNCFMPRELMKASSVLGLDIPLEVCHSITNVDSNLIIEGLMSVSNFKIINDCSCREDDQGRQIDDGSILSRNQTKDLFEAMENNTEINSVEIRGLDMTHLNQDELIASLFKIKNLKLAEGCFSDWIDQWGVPDPILDFELFVEKLLQAQNDSTNFKLSSLNLEYMQYPQSLSVDLANALCNVKSVTIGQYLPLRSATLKQIIQNILKGDIRMKCLFISPNCDWSSLISTEDLAMLITHMEQLQLWGRFSQEQVDIVKSLPGVRSGRFGQDLGKIWARFGRVFRCPMQFNFKVKIFQYEYDIQSPNCLFVSLFLCKNMRYLVYNEMSRLWWFVTLCLGVLL